MILSIGSRMGYIEKEIGETIEVLTVEDLIQLAKKHGRFSVFPPGENGNRRYDPKNETEHDMLYFEDEYD